MAEITVQRKGPGGWGWLIGVLALVLVGWAVVAMMNRDDEVKTALVPSTVRPADPSPAATAGDAAPAPAVAAFLTFADAPAGAAESAPVGLGHDYAADGIRRLTAALEEVVDDAPDVAPVRKQFTELQEKADRIQSDPRSLTHADQDRWPDARDLEDQLKQVRMAAARVDAARPLLDQAAAVKGFFDRAAGVVRVMAQRS